MSSTPIGSATQPLTITGLANGLNTSQIIAALMGAEREPVTRLTAQEEKLNAAQQQLRTVQSSLRALALAASEFTLPSVFESSQTATSSEPNRVGAATTGGAGVGGYQVEVKRLANSAQRTFTFTSPAAEDTITVEGREYKLAAGGTAKQLASAINSDSSGSVYAAALENGNIVFSSRATGASGAEFIKVSDPGGALAEVAGTAKEGMDAEYAVDGVTGTSASNTVNSAIAGVTLSLLGVTTTSGPVTIDVQAPGANVATVEAQVKSFVSTYNSTIEALQKQLTTKPPASPQNAAEYGTGTLFGDLELTGLVNEMRQAMYEPIAGLPAEMASPDDIGISTGGATGKATSSQSSIEGLLKLEPEKLANAVKTNAAGVETMLQKWSQGLQKTIEDSAQPGGVLEARITGEGTQVSEIRSRVATMDELLTIREQALVQTYAQLETVLAQSNSQQSWLASQAEGLTKSGL
ncbi:MAG TPA: flagellar filament capping protein FliD [Solirubrobacteraceae bacterium]|nr:flagellar filament capping protein FliD [Solirubrobacteraceae bacterium]